MHALPLVIPLVALSCSATLATQQRSTASPSLTEDSIDEASLDSMTAAAAPLIARSETLLSRVHFSPGEIDGQDGDNYRRALRAFQQANKLADTSKLDAAAWSALTHDQTEPVLKRYTITAEDVAGPFEKRLSVNLVDMARLLGLSYSSPSAELAEKFHMGEDMLHKLSPRANFSRAGEQIVVADLSPMPLRSTPIRSRRCRQTPKPAMARAPKSSLWISRPATSAHMIKTPTFWPSTRRQSGAKKSPLRQACSESIRSIGILTSDTTRSSPGRA
jgi:hypothetical protein